MIKPSPLSILAAFLLNGLSAYALASTTEAEANYKDFPEHPAMPEHESGMPALFIVLIVMFAILFVSVFIYGCIRTHRQKIIAIPAYPGDGVPSFPSYPAQQPVQFHPPPHQYQPQHPGHYPQQPNIYHPPQPGMYHPPQGNFQPQIPGHFYPAPVVHCDPAPHGPPVFCDDRRYSHCSDDSC